MCVALIKKSGVDLPSEDILRICFKNNPHGVGFALFRNNQIYLYKGFFTFAGFMKELKNIEPTKEEPMLIHFRVATHGKINIENCHPFPIVDKFYKMLNPIKVFTNTDVLVHNGKLNINITSNKFSDSMHFAKEIVGLDRKRFAGIINMAIAPTTSNTRGSRIAILTKDGEIEKYGEGWIEDDGIIYSNDSYKEFSIYKGHHKKTNTTTTTTYKTVIVNGKTTTVKTVSGQNTTGINTTKRIGFNNTENGFQSLNTCSKCSKYSIDCESVYIPNFGNNSIYTIKNLCPDCYQELGCVQCTTCKKHYYTNNITFYSDGRILCKECEEKATKNANSTSLMLVKP